MLMLWGWEKVFGRSEFALRAMNIPLFVIALAIVAATWRTSSTQRAFFVLFACSSAFVWAYLDEARPYILQFLGATACAIPLANAVGAAGGPRSSDIGLFAAGVVILCGSSLLGVVASFCFCIAFLLVWLMREPFSGMLQRPDIRVAAAASLPLLTALAVYYLWTLSLGARASSVGSTDIKSIAYGVYELLGVAGLGPGRGELRASPVALLAFLAPVLAYTLFLVSFICAGTGLALYRDNHANRWRGAVVFWFTPAAMAATAILAGIAGDFRLVGRHLTPLLPFVLILFSLAADALWGTRLRLVGRAIAILAILAMLGSALAYRTGSRHTKDDYRSAASLAHDTLAQGGTVWWAADPAGARYYDLDLGVLSATAHGPTMSANRAHLAWNVPESVAAMLPGIDMVILSKPDVYDEGGILRKLLASHNYTLHATKQSFRIYTVGSAPSSTGTK